MENELKAAELSDEEMTMVSGGARGSCPNGYTECTKANCLNAGCNLLVQNGDSCTCGNLVPGGFNTSAASLPGLDLTIEEFGCYGSGPLDECIFGKGQRIWDRCNGCSRNTCHRQSNASGAGANAEN